jgi:hypothetical protein
MLIAWDNSLVDAGTVTASSQISTLPASNVQDDRLSRKLHTAAGVETLSLLIDAGSTKSADLLAVLGTNLSASATVRLRASDLDPLAWGSLRLDTGVLPGGVNTNYGAIYKSVKAAMLALAAAGTAPSFYIDYTKGYSAPLIGNVPPTFIRATTATVKDAEGLVVRVLSGEMRYSGLRRERNLVATKSEDWSNAAWTKTNVTATAGDLTATAGNGTCQQSLTAASANYVLRVKLRRKTGSGNIQLTIDGASYTTVTLTTYDQVFSISQSAVTNPNFGIRIVTSGDAVFASEIGLHDVTGRANTNPPEYVSVGVIAAAPFHGAHVDGVKYFPTLNGNTVASNVVTESAGAAIADATLRGYESEMQRTNLLLRSEEIDNAAWTKTGATVSANATTAPDGTASADTLVEDGASSAHQITQSVTISAGNSITLSCKVKPASGARWLRLQVTSDANVNGFRWLFNPATGASALAAAAFGTGTVGATYIETLANGWYRVSVTGTVDPAATSVSCAAIMQNQAATYTATYTGDSASGLHLWGMQAEAVGNIGSYIPTTTATVTRNKDDHHFPTTGWLNAAEGTLVSEFSLRAITDASVLVRAGSIDDTTTNNYIAFRVSSNGTAECVILNATVTQMDTAGTVVAANTVVRAAVAYRNNDGAANINGGAVETDASLSPPAVTRISPSGIGGAVNQMNGFARKLYYIPKRITNAELITAEISAEVTAAARYWRLDLADATAADNLQVGRVVLAPGWETEINHEYGWSVGFEDRSEVVETDGGQEFFDERPRRRRVDFMLNWLTRAEAMGNAVELARANGIVHDVLAIPDIDEADYLSEQAIWGRLTMLEPVMERTTGIWAQKLSVLETL